MQDITIRLVGIKKEIQEKKEISANLNSEIVRARSELDRTQKDLMRSQKDRHELIEKWENAALLLNQTNKRLSKIKEEKITVDSTPETQTDDSTLKMLEMEREEMRKQIAQRQRKLARNRQLLQQLSARHDDLEQEVNHCII